MDNNNKEIENAVIEDSKNNDEKTNVKEETKTILSTIFTKSNFILIAWFLGIYFIAYFILGYFFPGSATNNKSLLSKTIDILFVSCFLIIVITVYYSMSDSQKDNFFSNFLSGLKDFINNPNSLLSVFSFILVFYLIIYLFRFPMSAEEKSMGISFIETTTWVLFIILIVVNFFKYLLKIPIVDILSKLFALEEKKEEENKKEEKIGEQSEEVFNVSNNLYTYEDAQAICTAYDAKLATYDQIEAAYADGA